MIYLRRSPLYNAGMKN